MASFNIEGWEAIAPSLNHKSEWHEFLSKDLPISEGEISVSLKHVPVMLRRRFNTIGKCAMGAISQLCTDNSTIPCIFASQHGDINLTVSLLESIAKQEEMSPTGFSLAVHNAISGLYSIVSKNTSSITAISSVNDQFISTFFEALGQLQHSERVLCVIYDTPLPEVYRAYRKALDFPFAVAFILSRDTGEQFEFKYEGRSNTLVNATDNPTEDLKQFIACLLGINKRYLCNANGNLYSLQKKSAYES